MLHRCGCPLAPLFIWPNNPNKILQIRRKSHKTLICEAFRDNDMILAQLGSWQ